MYKKDIFYFKWSDTQLLQIHLIAVLFNDINKILSNMLKYDFIIMISLLQSFKRVF